MLRGRASPIPREDYGEGFYPRYLYSETDVASYLARSSIPPFDSDERGALLRQQAEIARLHTENQELRADVSSLEEMIDLLQTGRIADAKAFDKYREMVERHRRRGKLGSPP